MDDETERTLVLARAFIFSIIPISIAYHLSHYISLLAIEGQVAIQLISDPFGFGWDLFNTSDYQTDITIINAKFVWYTSRCEGTNLPVVEALISGANVVTPVHTGIEDYLDSDYPLKLESKPVFMTEKWINLYGFKLKDGDRLPFWNKVSRKSNLEFLNNFHTHLLKNKNSNVKYKVKKYFSDDEIIKAIKS